MKNYAFAIATLVTLMMALTGCGQTSAQRASATSGADDPTPTSSVAATQDTNVTPTPTLAADGSTQTAEVSSDESPPAGPTATPTVRPAPTPTPDYDALVYEQAWQRRVDASFTDEECPAVPELTYAPGDYTGKLIDTHLHMPQLPDTQLGFEDGERDIEGFAQSEYGNRDDFDAPQEEPFPFADQIPVAGGNITMNTVACALQADGTGGGFAYFSVFTSQPDKALEIAQIAVERYPGLFVPFVSPPGEMNEVTTVDGDRLEKMLDAYPGVFKGLGEMRFNSTGQLTADVISNDHLMSTLPVLQERGMMMYMHPDDGQTDGLAQLFEDNPDTNFIAHGDQSQDDIASLMDRYPNIYYTIDALIGDQYLLHPEETLESYLRQTDDFEWTLEYDLAFWKEAIEAHPDRFMWGTDRGGTVLWGWDISLGRRLSSYARAFIGRLDPAVQEKFAYQNAERLIAASQGGG